MFALCTAFFLWTKDDYIYVKCVIITTVTINIALFCDVTSRTLVKDGNSEVPRNAGGHYKGTARNIPENRHVETVYVFKESFNLLVSVMDIQ